MNLSKYIAALCLTFLPFTVFSKTSIVFINGITTDESAAVRNKDSLEYRYCITSKKDCSNIEFTNFYNATDGFADDKGELTVQGQAETWAIGKANAEMKVKLPSKHLEDSTQYKKGSDEYLLFQSYLKMYLANIYYEQKLVNSAIWKDSNFAGLDPDNAVDAIQASFRTLAIKTMLELQKENNTRRVILVPHSQGNYFAQAIQALIKVNRPDLVTRLSIHGVASVSSIAQLSGEHTSHAADQALLAHAILDKFDRSPTIEVGWSLVGSTPEKDDRLQKHPYDITNHGFLEVYMSMQTILLPSDINKCKKFAVPTEAVLATREAYRINLGYVCQLKSDISDGKALIGVGNTVPTAEIAAAQRGILLAEHIVNKIADSKPPVEMVVADFDPISAVAGNKTTFSIKGGGLPQGKPLNIVLSGTTCTGFAYLTQTYTEHTFSCTPQLGDLTVNIRELSSAPVLGTFTVQVGETIFSNTYAVSPRTVTISKDITFTVTGTDLPDGMGFSVGDCLPSNYELPGGTATRRQFRCTINGVPGDRAGVLKDAPGGNLIYNFTVKAQVGTNTSQWVTTITPPSNVGFIVKQIVNADLLALPDGISTVRGESRLNVDATACHLTQTQAITVTKNGGNIDLKFVADSPYTSCSDGSHTAGLGRTDSYFGKLSNGVLLITPAVNACTVSYGACYNFTSFSPLP